jgi:glycosyltransferase involved in cell wall biosynthesis
LLGVDPGQARVIPRGIPLDRIPETPKSRSELGLPEDLPILINVGRQTAQKGHLALLDAFEIVKGERVAHLVILGRQGDASRELREGISGRGLQADVTVIDYTPDVFHYLAHASVFVFSSFMEGLGTAVLEAMASGVPVVAFDIPPVREATGEGRFAHLVAAGDIGALAGAVLDVLEDGRDLGGEAETWVAANYSLEVVAARLHGLLADVARGA